MPHCRRTRVAPRRLPAACPPPRHQPTPPVAVSSQPTRRQVVDGVLDEVVALAVRGDRRQRSESLEESSERRVRLGERHGALQHAARLVEQLEEHEVGDREAAGEPLAAGREAGLEDLERVRHAAAPRGHRRVEVILGSVGHLGDGVAQVHRLIEQQVHVAHLRLRGAVQVVLAPDVAQARVALRQLDVAVEQVGQIGELESQRELDVRPLRPVPPAALLRLQRVPHVLIGRARVLEQVADGLREPADRPVPQHHLLSASRLRLAL
mmetsp:Transcript_8126/g.28899  ORF Transcript_8126/g.28899 Transcript_8126/m.28899 type:complete len:266 (+) Transcript_8126:84-881(+)